MQSRKILWIGAVALVTGAAFAVQFGQKPKTPKQPWSDYVVHDGTRPQPAIVETGGAVSVIAPSDAKILFDGKDASAWKLPWKVENGLLIASPGDNETKEEFRDCQVHLEWRVPAGRKVNGQGGGNSGIFFMGEYEVQILQSNGNKTYPDGQAGAMYGQYPPLVNATAPQGEWQSYDLLFRAPRYEGGKCIEPAQVTVIHNGVMLHHAQKYHGPSTHKSLTSYPAEHPEKAPLKLQWHGDPIEFRNIWVREIKPYDHQEDHKGE